MFLTGCIYIFPPDRRRECEGIGTHAVQVSCIMFSQRQYVCLLSYITSGQRQPLPFFIDSDFDFA